MMDIIQTIESKYAMMGNKEKKLAEYIMKHAGELKNISIHDLAESLSIAPSTITRFCHRLGCQSFVEFKMQLHASHDSRIVIKGDLHTLVSSYYDEVISRTSELITEEMIETVVELMLSAKRILIYGMGNSGLSAEEFRMRLVRMGLQASAESDPHMIVMESKLTHEGDLVIGLSNSGDTLEIVEGLQNALYNGAKTISMTSVQLSKLDSLPLSLHLYLHNKKFLNEEYFINTQITALYIIDLITMKLLENEQLKLNMKTTYKRMLLREEQK